MKQRFKRPATSRRPRLTKPQIKLSLSAVLAAQGCPGFEDEVGGIVPGRRFRLDAGHRALKLGLEQQGGIWTGGKHGRGWGLIKDYEKGNLHILQGWVILQFTPSQIRNGEAAPVVKAAMLARGWRAA